MTEVVVSLDIEFSKAKELVDVCVNNDLRIFKVGHLLFDTEPDIIRYITSKGGKTILDLKFYDIPSVISKAIKGILHKYQIFAFTEHTLGGRQMLQETMSCVREFSSRPLVFGVTILTSLDDSDIKALNFNTTTAKEQVLHLAKFARQVGLDGVVCSGKEITEIKEVCGRDFLTLVPSVHLESKKSSDQKRSLSLDEVIERGADFVVIGRAIYDSEDIHKTIEKIKNILTKTKKSIK